MIAANALEVPKISCASKTCKYAGLVCRPAEDGAGVVRSPLATGRIGLFMPVNEQCFYCDSALATIRLLKTFQTCHDPAS